MDAVEFLLLRYSDVHRFMVEELLTGPSHAQVKSRPQPTINPIAWLLWHTARIEDVGVNRLLADRPQVLDDGWMERLAVSRRDVGTGMTGAEVDDLSARIDVDGLRGYWTAVTQRTLTVIETLRAGDLDAPVDAARVQRVAAGEGAVAPAAAWLGEFWASGRSRAWVLAQVALLHPYGHWFDARVTKGLWGFPSP
ncbi:MAG TPA: DinB family protein [Methylomirabilota bacterium]|jgi:hypothetical protein